MKIDHHIDEHCAYLEFVFGYDDTERIAVKFELGPSDSAWRVRIEEGEQALTQWHTIDAENFRPSFRNAEDLLHLYWSGKWGGTTMKMK